MFSWTYGRRRDGCFGPPATLNDPKPLDISLLINPLRFGAEIVRNVTNSLYDKHEGIWIGKRGLAKFPLTITTSVGFEVLHMAVMIKGIVYNLQTSGSKSNGHSIKIEISRDLVSEFDWRCYRRSDKKVIRSENQLRNYAKSFDNDEYTLIPVDGNNCQTFCLNMIKYATGENDAEIAAQYMIAIGTIIA